MTSQQTAKKQQICRALADYDTPYSDPRLLRAGQELAVGDRPSEWPGWIWCTTPEGASCWVPETYVTRQGETATLYRDYDATELSVRAGEELIVEDEESGWLWCVNNAGQRGWVPANHVQR